MATVITLPERAWKVSVRKGTLLMNDGGEGAIEATVPLEVLLTRTKTVTGLHYRAKVTFNNFVGHAEAEELAIYKLVVHLGCYI